MADRKEHKETIVFLWILLNIAVTISGECQRPPSIDGATTNIDGTDDGILYAEGTVAEYQCSSVGYKSKGSPNYTCTQGQWVGDFECIQQYCSPLQLPANSHVKESDGIDLQSIPYGGEVRIYCNTGYEPQMILMRCSASGNWSSISTECTKKTCVEFPSIVNSQAELKSKGMLHYGDVINVTCKDGFILSGKKGVECLTDGTWGTRPTCEKVNCGPHPGLTSPCIAFVYFNSRTGKLFLDCKSNATLVGSSDGIDYCDADTSKWNDPNMTCKCENLSKPEQKLSEEDKRKTPESNNSYKIAVGIITVIGTISISILFWCFMKYKMQCRRGVLFNDKRKDNKKTGTGTCREPLQPSEQQESLTGVAVEMATSAAKPIAKSKPF